MGKGHKAPNKLTIADRIIKALTVSGLMFVIGIALLLLAPIALFTSLIDSKPTDWEAIGKKFDKWSKEITDPDAGEDWKKNHDDQYGSE